MSFEKEFISKIKLNCGTQFTAKLEGMISDLSSSEQVQNQYFESMGEENKGFAVRILTVGHWPTQKVFDDVTLPSPMKELQSSFQGWYLNKFKMRKVKWAYTQSTCTVRANFT